MKPWNAPALCQMIQAGDGGIIVWEFSWDTLGHLVPAELGLNAIAYLSIVADPLGPQCAHLLMASLSIMTMGLQYSNDL